MLQKTKWILNLCLGFACLLSPEVGSTLMWFMRRWSVTYLSLQERFYAEISLALVTAFGENTEGAAWSIAFLLSKILSNLTSPERNSEPGLVKDTVLLLISLVDIKEK